MPQQSSTFDVILNLMFILIVMPAKAGIQDNAEKNLDASFRWHDNQDDIKLLLILFRDSD